MTTTLTDFTRIGNAAVAAIVETHMHAANQTIFASRKPVAILIHDNGVTTAFDADGSAIDLVELDAGYPGLRDEFETLAGVKSR